MSQFQPLIKRFSANFTCVRRWIGRRMRIPPMRRVGRKTDDIFEAANAASVTLVRQLVMIMTQFRVRNFSTRFADERIDLGRRPFLGLLSLFYLRILNVVAIFHVLQSRVFLPLGRRRQRLRLGTIALVILVVMLKTMLAPFILLIDSEVRKNFSAFRTLLLLDDISSR